MDDTPKDTARIVDGVVKEVAYWPVEAAGLGEDAPEQLVQFDPGQVRPGQLWDGSNITDPAAPVERLLLPKSVIQDRVQATGKFNAVWAIVFSQPYIFARWTVANQPNVYADDPDLLTILAAAGLTPEEIASATAA